MKNARWTQLLGMGSRPLRWERPLLFFAALCAGDLVWLILAPTTTQLSQAEGYTFELLKIPSAWTWLELLLGNLLIAFLATAAFGLIRNVFAIAPLALANSLLALILSQLFFLAMTKGSVRTTFWDKFRLYEFMTNLLWMLFFFVMVELALRVFKSLLLALVVGSVASTLALFVVNFILATLIIESNVTFNARLVFIPFRILSYLLFALTFWAGLRLTSGRSLDEAPVEPRVSKGFYLGTLAATYGVAMVLSVAIIIILLFTKYWKMSESSDWIPVSLLLVLLLLLELYGVVVFCVLIYKMWDAIQDGHAQTTPGWSVGGLFIPFYNFYWVFLVFPGFATGFNAFVARRGLVAPHLSTGIFKAYAVICILTAIPYIGLLFVPVGYVVLLIMVEQICRAINAVPVRQHAAAAPGSWQMGHP